VSISTHEQELLVKVFIGFQMSSEIRVLLGKNSLLQGQAAHFELELCEAHYQSKSYYGIFLLNPIVFMKEIQQKAEKLQSFIQKNCPDISLDSSKIMIFSQVFFS